MIENKIKMTNEPPISFEKQTVFKQSREAPSTQPPITGLGLSENVAGSLAYLLGFFSGFILLIVERENRFVRYHAFQSVYVSILFFTLFTAAGMMPMTGWVAEVLLMPIGLVLWIILMLNAHNGKAMRLWIIGRFAEKQLH
ncbi:DUF4870 domain-containing protein [Planococcus alpniumensis]|uniref:DUF4870 domain-containing protein n=1 Tax=Planococcus alpniumensis TaxID=2708345 RepID=UPI0020116ECB|nr:hypothetical protein [Planococcus sp. MSAK28401]